MLYTTKSSFRSWQSPENGNTRALAQIAMKALAEKRIESGEIDTADLDFKHPGCIACTMCQMSPGFGCHADDGLASAVSTLSNYDAIVLATPIYWCSYTAQIKMFIDSMFSLLKFGAGDVVSSPLRGKPLALLATGAAEVDENLDILKHQCRISAEFIGMPYISCLSHFCNHPIEKATKDATFLNQAREFAQQLNVLITI